MHRPPAVSWEVVAVRWPLRALAAMALLATVLLFFFAARQGWSFSSVCLLLLLPACVGGAFWGLQTMPKGRLHWDGEQWYWVDVDALAVSSLVCALDLQSLVLLHIRCGHRPGFWLWLEQRADGARWIALRRAFVVGPYHCDVEATESLR